VARLQTSLAFVFSSILHKSSSANAIGFFIFVIGGCLQLLVTFRFPFLPISGFPYDKRFATVWQVRGCTQGRGESREGKTWEGGRGRREMRELPGCREEPSGEQGPYEQVPYQYAVQSSFSCISCRSLVKPGLTYQPCVRLLLPSSFPLQALFSMFPPDMLAMGLKFLQDATVAPEDPGYTWGVIGECRAQQ